MQILDVNQRLGQLEKRADEAIQELEADVRQRSLGIALALLDIAERVDMELHKVAGGNGDLLTKAATTSSLRQLRETLVTAAQEIAS